MSEEWISEQLHPYYRKALKVKKWFVDEQTQFQHLQVAEMEYFGNTLILDGIIQLTEFDNPGYHELITHIPLMAVANPRRVLIVGGGDGGSLQQVLKHDTVEEVVVCELDQRVVEVCSDYFPAFQHPFDNSRSKLVIEDAFTFLQRNQGQFDVIISDTTDPIGMAERLFSEEFYRLMFGALTPGGAVVTQCEQMFFDIALIREIFHFTKSLCTHPAYYHGLIPTYPGGGIGFMYVSDTPWTHGLGKPYPSGLNYLNADIHQAAFALPEFFRRQLEA